MDDPALPFDELLARARAGDADATAALVRRYEPEVRAVARVRLGPALRPHLDTADLVQSVHKSLLVGLRANRFAFDSPAQLVALAVTIVRRKAARQWQRCRRQARPGADDTAPLPEVLLALADPAPDPAAAAAARDAAERVCRGLDPLDRQVLELAARGYKTVEIAGLVGQNADALRVRLSRLRARLRAAGVAGGWV